MTYDYDSETSVTVRVNDTGRTVNVPINPGTCTFLAFDKRTGELVEMREIDLSDHEDD